MTACETCIADDVLMRPKARLRWIYVYLQYCRVLSAVTASFPDLYGRFASIDEFLVFAECGVLPPFCLALVRGGNVVPSAGLLCPPVCRPVSLGRYAGREGGDRPQLGGQWNTGSERERCAIGRGNVTAQVGLHDTPNLYTSWSAPQMQNRVFGFCTLIGAKFSGYGTVWSYD